MVETSKDILDFIKSDYKFALAVGPKNKVLDSLFSCLSTNTAYLYRTKVLIASQYRSVTRFNKILIVSVDTRQQILYLQGVYVDKKIIFISSEDYEIDCVKIKVSNDVVKRRIGEIKNMKIVKRVSV